MEIGTSLRKLRDYRRLSSREVADVIGVSQSTYLNWESDQSSPSFRYFCKLTQVFDVDSGDLIKYFSQDLDLKDLTKVRRGNAELIEMVSTYQEVVAILRMENKTLREERDTLLKLCGKVT